MSSRASSAVVLGASIGGLLAARALGRHFDQVTLVERDALSDDACSRKGVPQGAHAHGLLAGGYRMMEDFFPGIMAELEAEGAPGVDVTGDFLWFQYGRWKLRHRSGMRGLVATRPALEAAIRRRVRAMPNVAIIQAEGLGPRFDPATSRVTGLSVRLAGSGVEEFLASDLLVDASGRGSQSPRWLEEWGFGRPDEVAVKIDVGYATRLFRRRPGELFGSYGAIVSDTPPAGKRAAGVMAVEGDRWLVTLGGKLGDRPPTDEEGWLNFAAGLPVKAVHDLVSTAEPLSDIEGYRFPANRRRLYDAMERAPDGFLVVADALCSFNPTYGQGMTVAAGEAKALDAVLADGLDRLWARFYERTRPIVDTAWAIAAGEDLKFPEVEGPRRPGSWLINRYAERVHAVASEDPIVCRAFFDVLNLIEPPSVLKRPAMMWRVLTRSLAKGQGSPQESAPPGAVPVST